MQFFLCLLSHIVQAGCIACKWNSMQMEGVRFMAQKQGICKSVFRNGGITKSQYTKIWIALINQIEKNKRITVGKC